MRVVLIFLLGCFFQVQANEVSVAAATNLRYVLPEIAEKFEQQTGHHLALSFAASGTLTTQILHNAPFEVFLSANPDYVERLIDAKKTDGGAIEFSQAQLALYAAKHSSLDLDADLHFLTTALKTKHLKKVVMANPKHAPYGKAAEAVLRKAGLWESIQPYLLVAENASQAVQFAMSTSVDVGFVPYAHVIQPKLKSLGSYVKLDSRLSQQAVLLTGASEAAKQFLIFLQTNEAEQILLEHGFVIGKNE